LFSLCDNNDHSQITDVSLHNISKIVACCHHLVNAISLGLARSDHIKRGILYLMTKRQTERQMKRQTNKQKDKQKDRRKDRKINEKTERQTKRHTNIFIFITN
jgi:hypothetical protein